MKKNYYKAAAVAMAAVLICSSFDVQIYGSDTAAGRISVNEISDTPVMEDQVSGNSVSDDTVSYNALSDDTVIDYTASGDAADVTSGSSGGFESGSGTAADPYIIDSLDQFRYFADGINNSTISNYSTSYYKMGADIRINSEPGGTVNELPRVTNEFRGHFDGDGHFLYNVYINAAVSQNYYGYVGVFSSIGSDGEVKNLSVSGANIAVNVENYNQVYAGIIAGSNSGTINGCHLYGNVIFSGVIACCGGIAGTSSGKVSDCDSKAVMIMNEVISSGNVRTSSAGAVVGSNQENGVISDCSNAGPVSVVSEGVYSAGGIAGTNSGEISRCVNKSAGALSLSVNSAEDFYIAGIVYKNSGTISDCDNQAPVAASSDNGSAAGICYDNHSVVTGCTNEGDISGCNAYGIAGNSYADKAGCSALLRLCTNSGKVTAGGQGGEAAGIAGYIGCNNTTVQTCSIVDCSNSGKISGKYASGICAEINELSDMYVTMITGCSNGGQIEGTDEAAGIIYKIRSDKAAGSQNASDVIKRCSNTGSISAGTGCGGIAAEIWNGTIMQCFNKGNLQAGCAGGIVCYAQTGNGDILITDCFNSGEIKKAQSAGGVAYWLYAYGSGLTVSLDNCYNSGSAAGSSSGSAAGIVNCAGTGSGGKIAGVSRCYSINSFKGVYASKSGSEGSISFTDCSLLTPAEMKTESSYKGWDFSSVWEMGDEDYPYPVLSMKGDPQSGTSGNVSWSIDGNGTLSVSGNGDWNKDSAGQAPWYPYAGQIKKAVVTLTGTTDAGCMFYRCYKMKEVDLKGFDTSSVTDMSNMFAGCSSLPSVDLLSLNTSSVENMSRMFYCCRSLGSVNLTKFITKNVSTVDSMFYDCYSLKSLDLSKFDTGNLTDMGAAFFGCRALTELNMSSFDASKVTDVYAALTDCSSLVTIYAPKNVKKESTLPGRYYDPAAEKDIQVLPLNLSASRVIYRYCTIKYVNYNGQDDTKAEYAPSKEIEEPDDPVRSGYRFKGYYENRNCQGAEFFSKENQSNRLAMRSDITLYAKWNSSADLTQDELYRFLNASGSFGNGKYYLSDYDRSVLMNAAGFPDRLILKYHIDHEFEGSCFGMSSSVVLMNGGYFNISDFDPSAQKVSDAKVICSTDSEVESMINFYFFTQNFSAINNYISYSPINESANISAIISKFEKDNSPKLIYISNSGLNDLGKHAVVGYDFSEDSKTGTCTLNIYDCNFGRTVWPIKFVKSNKKYTVQFLPCESFNTEAYIRKSDRMKDGMTWEEACKADFDGIFFRSAISAGDLYSVARLDGLNSGSCSSITSVPEKDLELTTSYGSFIITDGTDSATVSELEKTAGSLKIEFAENAADTGSTPEYRFSVPALTEGRKYTIMPVSSVEEYDTTAADDSAADAFFSAVSTGYPAAVTVAGDGTVKTDCDTAVKQTVTVAREDIDTPWYYDRFTADSAGVSAGIEGNAVKVSTTDGAAVDILLSGDINTLSFNDISTADNGISISEKNGECRIENGNNASVSSDTFGYSVIFDSGIGTEVNSYHNIVSGDSIKEPEAPTANGYIFKGWYKESARKDKWDFESDTVSADTVLYSDWESDESGFNAVRFVLPDGSTESVTVLSGNSLTDDMYPDAGSGEKYVWYTDPEYSSEYVAGSKVLSGLILYGKAYSEESFCSVSFDSAGGTDTKTQHVMKGSRALKPDDPDRYGYSFEGWDTVQDISSAYDFGTTVSEDIILYAKWKVNTYDISFDMQGGTGNAEKRSVSFGSAYGDLPSGISRTGYDFKGWYTGKRTGAAVSGDSILDSAENTTLYARWEAHICTVTLDANGGSFDGEKQCTAAVSYGKRLFDKTVPASDPALPVYFRHKITGWYDAASGGSEYDLNRAVSEDLILYAHWGLKYKADKPEADIADGSTVKKGTMLSLKTATEGAAIYYTDDGTDPLTSTTKKLYEDSIPLNDAVSVNAVAIEDEYENSDVLKVSYTVKDDASDWGDVTDADKTEKNFTAVSQIPAGLWLAGLKECDYTGTAAVPSDLHVYFYRTRLAAGTDYTVKYTNNKNAGTASVKIICKGTYSGTVTSSFLIKPLDISGASADDILLRYNGKVQKGTPQVTYSLDGKKVTLKKGRDFVYDYPGTDVKKNGYDDNAFRSAGKYVLKLVGKGNFAGTEKTVTETITEKTLMSSVKVSAIASQAYTGYAIKPEPAVTFGGRQLMTGSDYTVSYTDNTEIGTAAVTLSGNGDYAGTKTVTFKITGRDIKGCAVTGFAASYIYTGSAIEPAGKESVSSDLAGGFKVCLKAGRDTAEKILEKGTDYTVSYSKNTNAGTGAVIIKGINGYTGTVRKTFRITAYNIKLNTGNRISADEIGEVTYLKGGAKPEAVLSDNNTGRLAEGTDYTVRYANNASVNDGSGKKRPTVIITGKGNYAGSVNLYYTIAGSSLDKTSADAGDIVFLQKANICRPVLKIRDADGKALKAGTDYEKAVSCIYARDAIVQKTVNKKTAEVTRSEGDAVDPADIIPAGTEITAVITGKGSYSGKRSVSFRFIKANISRARIQVADQNYSSGQVKLSKSDITVTLGGKKLEKTDYEIAGYLHNDAAGNASVTIRGKGSYGGSKTVNFRIKGITVK